jgi:hypothetical protein
MHMHWQSRRDGCPIPFEESRVLSLGGCTITGLEADFFGCKAPLAADLEAITLSPVQEHSRLAESPDDLQGCGIIYWTGYVRECTILVGAYTHLHEGISLVKEQS